MTNYDDLPLFPLHVVLFPEMPLPLHIFEPRYREMILRCREENSPFGVTLIGSGDEVGPEAIPCAVGTTARIAQCEELADGRMNILVIGETRFRILRTLHDKPYLSAQVQPFGEQAGDAGQMSSLFADVTTLFKAYLKSLLAMTGRTLSALQLPQDPESLSYAIAGVLQSPPPEKQNLLEMTDTAQRLAREIQLLEAEIEAQASQQEWDDSRSERSESLILPVDTRELGKLASLN